MLKILGPKRIAVVVLGGLALAGAIGLALSRLGGTRVASEAELVDGARLYRVHCAACHGVNLEGEADWRRRRADGTLPGPPHDASGHTWHHPDRQLFAITKFGTAALIGGGYKSNMRGFADDLSDAEIRAVLGYIRSRWPDDIRRRQREITARAAGRAE